MLRLTIAINHGRLMFAATGGLNFTNTMNVTMESRYLSVYPGPIFGAKEFLNDGVTYVGADGTYHFFCYSDFKLSFSLFLRYNPHR